MTPRQARRAAAGKVALVVADDTEGIVLLLPVHPLRQMLLFLRKVVPQKLDGAVRFDLVAGQVKVQAASKSGRVVAGGPIPALVPDEALERWTPLHLEAWRLERLLALKDIGDRIQLVHDPVQGLRTWARALWPLVLPTLRAGVPGVVCLGRRRYGDARGREQAHTRLLRVQTEDEAQGVIRAAHLLDPSLMVALASVEAGVALLEAVHEDNEVQLRCRAESDDRPRERWRLSR